MSTRHHYHHSLQRYPNNIVHMRRMDGHGKIHHTTERVHPSGYIEVLKQVNNRYVPSHIIGVSSGLGRQHIQNTTTLMHAKGGSAHSGLSSKQILDKIYSGFSQKKGSRKLI